MVSRSHFGHESNEPYYAGVRMITAKYLTGHVNDVVCVAGNNEICPVTVFGEVQPLLGDGDANEKGPQVRRHMQEVTHRAGE